MAGGNIHVVQGLASVTREFDLDNDGEKTHFVAPDQTVYANVNNAVDGGSTGLAVELLANGNLVAVATRDGVEVDRIELGPEA